jgi:hypothetical protein
MSTPSKTSILEEDALIAPIRTLLEADRITEARQLVELLLKASPSLQLEQWAQMLAPPVAHSGEQETGTGSSSARQWLRQHAKEYAGQWVALREGALLGANTSRVALHQSLQRSGALEGALFVRL